MLAVTTRNVLRSTRFCWPMLRARRLIAQQLRSQPGLIRYASGLVSPTEFLTLTVWTDRQAMQRFMQTGAHEQHMWLFSRWTSSFWGMRWEPVEQPGGTSAAVSPLVTAGLLPASVPRAGPLGPRPVAGAGSEPRGAHVVAVTALFDGIPSGARAWSATRRLSHAQRAADTGLLRWSAGVDLPPRVLAISLWRRGASAHARELFHGADWLTSWRPADYEIGHWNGLRLRQVARQQARDRVDTGQ